MVLTKIKWSLVPLLLGLQPFFHLANFIIIQIVINVVWDNTISNLAISTKVGDMRLVGSFLFHPTFGSFWNETVLLFVIQSGSASLLLIISVISSSVKMCSFWSFQWFLSPLGDNILCLPYIIRATLPQCHDFF